MGRMEDRKGERVRGGEEGRTKGDEGEKEREEGEKDREEGARRVMAL